MKILTDGKLLQLPKGYVIGIFGVYVQTLKIYSYSYQINSHLSMLSHFFPSFFGGFSFLTGKKTCGPERGKVLKVLSDLLGHEDQEVY